jgi:predicted HNH restriction endonuclease
MPGCGTILFERDNGKNYVEVHHVIPLGEDGDDSLANAAALCPQCHREQHFGKGRAAKRKVLKAYIDGLPD